MKRASIIIALILLVLLTQVFASSPTSAQGPVTHPIADPGILDIKPATLEAGTPPANWDEVIFDYQSSAYGEFSTISIVPGTNIPRIAFWDAENESIVTWHGGDVYHELALSTPGTILNSRPDMEVDSKGQPHVVWATANGDVYFSKYNFLAEGYETWKVGDGAYYDPTGEVPMQVRIALDSNDRAHIVYYRDKGGVQSLEYAHWVAGLNYENLFVRRTLVTGEHGSIYGPSIDVAADGSIHIAYFDRSSSQIRYIRKTPSSVWPSESSPVKDINIPNEVYRTAIAVGGDSIPHLTYTQNPDGRLGYCENVGAPHAWTCIYADFDPKAGRYHDIALDGSNNPHISYYFASVNGSQPDGYLRYVYYDGSSWQWKVLDTEGDTGYYSSIAIDYDNKAHIAYYDGYQTLRYWFEEPDSSGDLGNVGCAWGSEYCNPCAANVIDSFENLHRHGDILTYFVDRDANPIRNPAKFTYHHHWQGLARPMANGEPYLVTSLDWADHLIGTGVAVFSVAHFESANTDGYRFGPNRSTYAVDLWSGIKLMPIPEDKVVHSEWVSVEQPHPGGLQMVGDILAIPFTGAEYDIMFYNLADPESPVFVNKNNLDGDSSTGISTAAVVQMDDGHYILAAYSQSASLDFYRSNTINYISANTGWYLLDKISVPDDVLPNQNWDNFQSLNFVTDCGTGKIYLVATGNMDGTGSIPATSVAPAYPDGNDQALLYEVDIDTYYYDVSINLVGKRFFDCGEQGDHTDYCNFDAAAGIYVDPSNRMILYATEHASDGYQETVKMKEFRPVPHSTCASLEDSWIEVYKSVQPDQDFGLLMEYPEYNNTIMDNLKVWGWEDKIWSVGWCAPPGYSYIMYEDKNPCSGRMTKLDGYGTYAESPLSYMGGEASCIRLVEDASLRYSIDPQLGRQWDYVLDDIQIVNVSAPMGVTSAQTNDDVTRSISVDIDPDTFLDTMDVVFENISPPTHPYEGNYPTSYNFYLGQDGFAAYEDFVFEKPVMITFFFAVEDLTGLDELSLAPFYWDTTSETWVGAHTTCPGSPWPYFDEDTNTIMVEICKFGEYALWAYREPIQVAVDEMHDNRMSLSWARAQEIATEEGGGAQPEWYYLSALNAAGGYDYHLDALNGALLTDAMLEPYDVLLIPHYRQAFGDSEVEAVLRFVDRGGGLVITGDCGYEIPNWALTGAYDTVLQPQCLFGPYPQVNGELALDINTLHPSMAVVTDVVHIWSQSLELYGEAQSILTTPDDTWMDEDWSGDFNSSIDIVDDFDAGAAYDTGCGRVVVLGDNAYSDEDLAWTENETIMKSVLMWASEGTPCEVPDDRYPIKVLVDEGHDNWLTLDWTRAAELAAIWGEGSTEHDFILDTLTNNLTNAYQFARNTGALTSSRLQDYDILVIPVYGESFTTDEVNAVHDFVTRGGGLMILGDAYNGLPDPELATTYGFRFLETTLFRMSDNEGTYDITLTNAHPAMTGADTYITSWGQAISTTFATDIMGILNYEVYSDSNFNQVYDAGEEGEFVMAAAYDTGCGRVIGFGDNVFSDSTLEWTDNDRVFRSMLDWLSAPNACHRNILVDEAHDNHLTVHWDRAEEIVTNQGWGNATFYILDTLSDRLDDDFTLSSNPDMDLTLDRLLPYDAVVIPWYFEAMTEDEVAAVKAYVRQGGGVLFVGDAAYDNPNPELTHRFGFTFRNETLFAPVPQANPLLQIDAFTNHPSVENLKGTAYDFTMEGGCSVELGDATEAILTTNGLNAWRDMDWNDIYSAAIDETGEFTVAAVYDAGCGRAAVIADDNFGDDPLYATDNEELMRELLHWVSSGTACNAIGDIYIPLVLK